MKARSLPLARFWLFFPLKRSVNAKARKRRSNRNAGFSLVVSLLMLVLLTVVAVGLLSLSTITLRSSQADSATALARANARMALILALGDLQKTTGPDQRVTAPARILDSAPATARPEGVTGAEWVGVWSANTNGNLTDPALVTRGTGSDVGLRDVRLGVRRNPLLFLVSGSPTSATTARPADAVTIASVGTGSNREVWVPRVGVIPSSANAIQGGYGYWIKDLSTMAPLNLYNRNGAATASAANPGNGGYSSLMSPASQSASVIPGFTALATASPDNLKKAVTANSAMLASSDSAAIRDTMKTSAVHSVGGTGYGLLVDSMRGGLRRNLTPYFNGNGSLSSDVSGMNGISDTDPIIADDARMAKFSPKFGVLRSYAKLADKVGGSFTSPSIDVQIPTKRADNYAPERINRIEQGVHPVITEYSVYVDIVFNTQDRYFYLVFFPRVTLYNPYNARINSRPYHIQITNRIYTRWDVEVADEKGIYTPKTIEYNNYWGDNAGFGLGGRNQDLCFYLEATSLEPGEALVFSPKASSGTGQLFGKSAQLQFPNGGNMAMNVLSAAVPPTDMNSFYARIGSVQPSSNFMPTYRIKRHSDNGFHFGYDMSLGARLRTPASGSSLPTSMSSINNEWPVIQALDSDNWFRGNNGRWRDNNQDYALYTRDTFISNGVTPNNRTQFGFRLKWFQETDSNISRNPGRNWNAAPLVNYDIRSEYSHRNPWDSIFQVADHYNEFCWGQYAIDTLAPGWTDPDVLPAYSGGKQRISPFYRSTQFRGGHTFPLFELPNPQLSLVGLGQLRHAHLSSFSFWPSYIVGESYAPLMVARRFSSPTLTEVESAWTSSAQQFANAPWWEKNNGSNLSPSEFNVFYDVCYEVNHALWDSYFLTGLNGSERGWTGNSWNPNEPMPNPRMVPNPFDPNSRTKQWMNGYRRAAQALVIEAPFNVNTADKDAWAALLKSFRGKELPTRKAGGQITATQQAFSRLIVPDEGGATSMNSTARANWAAFQQLPDSKIDLLAESLVREVKRRGPFVSLSDFVNRRLVTGTDNASAENDRTRTGLVGALQAALDDTTVGINNFVSDYAIPQDLRSSLYPIVTDGAATEKRGEGSHLPAGKAAMAPGFVSQGDILGRIGHVLTARGDTFVIRAYGEARSADGTKILARAYCEATVQRVHRYVESTLDQPEVMPTALTSPINRIFGRRYEIMDFRWLSSEEI